MKSLTALLALTLTATLSFSAAAQSVAGSWKAEEISSAEPPEGAALTLTFADEGKATITYTLAGEKQSWAYTYAVEENQLKLEPANPFGEPSTITYDIRFEEGKLLLLTPEPEPIEEETDEAEGEAEGETEGEEAEASEEGEAEETAETEEEEAEEEEEDTRTPVWVLVKA